MKITVCSHCEKELEVNTDLIIDGERIFCDEDCETEYWCQVEDRAYLQSIGDDEDQPL